MIEFILFLTDRSSIIKRWEKPLLSKIDQLSLILIILPFDEIFVYYQIISIENNSARAYVKIFHYLSVLTFWHLFSVISMHRLVSCLSVSVFFCYVAEPKCQTYLIYISFVDFLKVVITLPDVILASTISLRKREREGGEKRGFIHGTFLFKY